MRRRRGKIYFILFVCLPKGFSFFLKARFSVSKGVSTFRLNWKVFEIKRNAGIDMLSYSKLKESQKTLIQFQHILKAPGKSGLISVRETIVKQDLLIYVIGTKGHDPLTSARSTF